MNITKKARRQIIELIIIAGIVLWCVFNYKLFFKFINYVVKLVMPLIVGIGIAFIVNVPMKQIERKIFNIDKRKNKKLIRILSLTISIVLILGIFILIFFLIIPEFIDALNSLIKTLPDNINWLNNMREKAINMYPEAKEYIKSIDTQMIMDHTIGNTGTIISIIVGIISSMISKIVTGFFGFILSIYILADKENLMRKGKKLLSAFLPDKVVLEIRKIIKLTNTTFTNFISGQCLDACLTGFEFFILLSIIKVPYALILGVLFTITALIPFIGAFITLVVGACLVAVTNPSNVIWYVIIFFLLQQFDDNVTYPRIVGKAVGLPPIIALVAVLLGGSVFGFIGMIISIPLASVLYTLTKEFVNYRLENKNKKVGGKK